MLLAKIFASIAVICLTIVPSLGMAAAPRFRFEEVPVAPGLTGGEGIGVNNLGAVLVSGNATSPTFSFSYLWHDDRLTEIRRAGVHTSVLNLNDNNWVSGFSGDGFSDAFVWREGVFTNLGEIAGGQRWGRPHVLGNDGQIFGYSLGDPGNSRQMFSWADGVFTKIGFVDVGFGTSSAAQVRNTSQPNDRNSSGDVIGVSTREEFGAGSTPGTRYRSWIMRGGIVEVLDEPEVIAADTWQARLIGDNGEYVGSGNRADGLYVYGLVRNGMFEELEYLPGDTSGAAMAMNGDGTIVGFGYQVDEFRAALWKDGQVLDLNQLALGLPTGWRLEVATSINELGQITGRAKNAEGWTRPFLLTPVPEPSTVAMIATAGLLFAGLRLRGRIWPLIDRSRGCGNTRSSSRPVSSGF